MRVVVFSDLDCRFMDIALRLAERGLGNTWPNPAVGCLIVSKDGVVVGRGWTAPGGRPHAETSALSAAHPDQLCGATVYVTLEPCSHVGHTSPCVDALIEARVARCVVACLDPDKRVDGRGVARLRRAGIETEVGLLAERAAYINRGFFLRTTEDRPLFTLKLASTLDGRIATSSGESRWITGLSSRRVSHLLRAEHDGVLVGSGTAIADDPDLRCRLEGVSKSNIERIVLDGRLRLSLDSRLVATAQEDPVVVLTRLDADVSRKESLQRHGVEVISLRSLTPWCVAEALANRGLTRVFIEGGASVAASFLGENLVDSLVWFHAPMVVGGDGRAAVENIGVLSLAQSRTFIRRLTTVCGEDSVSFFDRVA